MYDSSASCCVPFPSLSKTLIPRQPRQQIKLDKNKTQLLVNHIGYLLHNEHMHQPYME